MWQAIHDLGFGLGVAVHPLNLLAGALGVVTGTVIGVIPALGPTQGAALLLPIVFRLPPATGLIFLSGLYMGAIYGGSVTSILFNIPGTPMAAASAFDGYPMAMKGEGARALAGSSLSAFIAGTVCIILFTLFARPVAEYALTWGPPEYFSVMIVAYAALAGVKFLVVVVGMFGVGELLRAGEENIMAKAAFRAKVTAKDIFGALK